MLALPSAAHAADIYVSTTGSDALGAGTEASPFATIQYAIDTAVGNLDPSDNVHVAAGEYTGNITMKDCVSLYGAGSAETTITGTGAGSVVTINSIGTGETLSGFTISGGIAPSFGGGIYCDSSSPTIEGCTISGNTASYGGGVFCILSSPTIEGCTISDNSADYGGGIWCTFSSLTVTDCTISGNRATMGGGIYCTSSSPTITDCTISGNSAAFDGGGIFCYDSSPTITDCTISDNTESSYGGGIFCWYSSPTITNCTISDNSAVAGSGICCHYSSPTITDCTISDNSADYGGGIWCTFSSLTVTDCTISGNGGLQGGGIFCGDSSLVITNCTISDNTAASGGGIYCRSSSPTITNCIVWNNGDDLYNCIATYSCISTAGDATGDGNITDDPRFVDATNDDYRLQSGSPCIDTATSEGAPATDIDGVVRPQCAGYDMGAHEYYVVSDPTLSSATHTEGVWSNNKTVTVDITAATGTAPAAAGYAISISQNATAYPATTITQDASAQSFSFDAATDGTWYVNVATLDVFDCWSEGVSFGPIVIDTTTPVTTASVTDSTGEATVRFTSSDAMSGVAAIYCTVDGGAVGSGSSVVASGTGTHTIVYWASDKAGNVELSHTLAVEIAAPAAGGTDTTPDDTDASDGGGTAESEGAAVASPDGEGKDTASADVSETVVASSEDDGTEEAAGGALPVADGQAAPADEQNESGSLGWIPWAVLGLVALLGGFGAWQVLARPRP